MQWIPEISRWLREGPIAAALPLRVRTSLERLTAERGYPGAGGSLTIPVASGSAEASLLFGGDLALHRWRPPTPPSEMFSGIRALLATSDARFFNLETQITARTEPAGTIGLFLRADPAAVEAMDALRPTAVTCANNHCLDFGPDALLESMQHLAARSISVIGIRQGDHDAPIVLPVRGVHIGHLAYADDWYHAEGSPPFPRPAPHDPTRVTADIMSLKHAADLVVVQLHWGYEWTMYPLKSLRDQARAYVEAGADLVICHHAHVPMGVERWAGGLIAHGLGNFYFGPRRRRGHPFTHRSFVLRVRVSRTAVIDAEVIPVQTTHEGGLESCVGQARDTVLRAVTYVSGRLDRDAYLDRLEEHIVATQGCTLMRDMARRLAGEDARGAWERVVFLSLPRQRWLGDQLARRTDALRDIGDMLRRLQETPDARILESNSAQIGHLGERADAWLERTVPIGRLP